MWPRGAAVAGDGADEGRCAGGVGGAGAVGVAAPGAGPGGGWRLAVPGPVGAPPPRSPVAPRLSGTWLVITRRRWRSGTGAAVRAGAVRSRGRGGAGRCRHGPGGDGGADRGARGGRGRMVRWRVWSRCWAGQWRARRYPAVPAAVTGTLVLVQALGDTGSSRLVGALPGAGGGAPRGRSGDAVQGRCGGLAGWPGWSSGPVGRPVDLPCR